MMTPRMRLALSTALASTCILAGSASVALAHAQYSGSTPGAGAMITAVPSVLQIIYTQ
jgi:methionine-rich copper-binding protein CopC